MIVFKMTLELIKEIINDYKDGPDDYLSAIILILLISFILIPASILIDIILLPLEIIAIIIYKHEWRGIK